MLNLKGALLAAPRVLPNARSASAQNSADPAGIKGDAASVMSNGESYDMTADLSDKLGAGQNNLF
ncbi:hypothetical protein [Erythrobacter sp. YT30]|uniref:hypothetical protein n=1 Tax=Erythrobacter sp. YT30 TaxID=1735012 RepID=UPI00076C6CD7|nr:hypothetical protein [Erythrobacter sp. YT30]KWV91788.1 hypothetical protein AUC45_11330 [Erythrobacter sp. YT30]